ncbi:hypothetical protein JMUB5695_04029 [Mycobacterium heckeshornense]|nr:hypothetical protein JMUB5695_04029 [Mycobacterium heckeshornense]
MPHLKIGGRSHLLSVSTGSHRTDPASVAAAIPECPYFPQFFFNGLRDMPAVFC